MVWRILPLVALLGSAPALATALPPEDMATLAKQTGDACLGGQVKEAANKNLRIAQLQDFCTCYGKGIAGEMQLEDVVKDDIATPKIEKLAAIYFKKCAASVFKK